MLYIVMVLLGLIAGGAVVLVAMEPRRWRLQQRKQEQDVREVQLQEAEAAAASRRQELDRQALRANAEQQELKLQAEGLKTEHEKSLKAIAARQAESLDKIRTQHQELDERAQRMRAEWESRIVSYKELLDENGILKGDLRNLQVSLRKSQLDHEQVREAQEAIDRRGKDLGTRYLKDSIKWIGSSLTQSNFVISKQRLQDVIEWCRGVGLDISSDEEAGLVVDLKEEYEKIVRAAFEREEQARIKARIREEQLLEKEIERELKQLERERAAIQAALEKALAEAKDEHSEEIERLRERLAEAEAKSQRAMSRAQMTKAGHVYVISNIGSFGDGVFKVGVSRRLEPMERIRELGNASVPFPFDVHMMISCDDALTLENALHRALHKLRVNKINPRKEYFKTDIEAIRQIVEQHHGEVQYIADAEALEYRQSLAVSDEDEESIESVYDKLGEEGMNDPEDV